jgi:predicted RecB family nuclease
MAAITASILYAYVECEHRVRQDRFENPANRDPVSPFVELLWERGTRFERETIEGLQLPFLDLSKLSGEEKERETQAAMQRNEPLIYGGRISHGDLLGEPDLLRLEGNGYVPGDIKSGAGEEGGDEENDGKPKKRYAVQLALYVDVLERLGRSSGRRAFVWDVHGEEVTYDFDQPQGQRNKQTLWQFYEETLADVRQILDGTKVTLPAAASVCNNCHWYSTYREAVVKADDLSQIAELGRTKRDAMVNEIPTVEMLAEINPDAFIVGKKTRFSGIGPDTLKKFQSRARLLKTPNSRPFLTRTITLPVSERELHFDIEDDPMRDIVYLHGFVVREPKLNEPKFVSFVAEAPSPEAEKRAFAQSMNFFRENVDAKVYVYSTHERTKYRKLQQRYPNVATADEIEALFDPSRTVDLYALVKSSAEFPTWNKSLKTLAKFLGFQWRDSNPSGAASIEWFHRYVETGDRAILDRILTYNDDDCRAMIVLLDALREMS